MTIVIDGTTGISGVDGSSATPAMQGSDSNTGISYGTDTVTINTGGVARVTTDASGNVGIGTSSPSAPLDVVSDSSTNGLRIRGRSSDNAGSIRLYSNDNATQYGLLRTDASAVLLSAIQAVPLTFGTTGAERMRLDSSGNLLVGTTSNFGAARTSINSASTVLALYCSGSSGSPGIVIGKASNDASTSQILMQFLYNNGTAGLGQINGNGGSQAAFGSYSDARLKENITDLPTQLEKICALRPVEFDYKDGSGHQIGFIAQEIQEVYPDAVGVGHNEMLTVTGWNKTEAYLVKAIQELKAEFDAYKAAHP